MKINRFKKIIVLSEFTQMDYPYGLYWCHYVSATQDRWFLVMRNGCDVCLYSHYHKTTPKECALVRAEINGNFESYIKVTSHLKLVRKRMEELGLLNENQKPEPAKNKENVPDCGTHET